MELPLAVTATLANGQVLYLDPSTKIASVPHWPGAVVWGAKIPFQHGVTLTAYWPGNAAAPLKFSEHVGRRRRQRTGRHGIRGRRMGPLEDGD